jgi:hypothetical protein
MIFFGGFIVVSGVGVSLFRTKLTKIHEGHEDLFKLRSEKIKNL